MPDCTVWFGGACALQVDRYQVTDLMAALHATITVTAVATSVRGLLQISVAAKRRNTGQSLALFTKPEPPLDTRRKCWGKNGKFSN